MFQGISREFHLWTAIHMHQKKMSEQHRDGSLWWDEMERLAQKKKETHRVQATSRTTFANEWPSPSTTTLMDLGPTTIGFLCPDREMLFSYGFVVTPWDIPAFQNLPSGGAAVSGISSFTSR